MILEKYVNLKVNSFLRANNIDQKMKECIFSGDIDLLENISECDVILGGCKLKCFQIPNIPLQGTEQFVYDLGEKLINTNIASIEDVYDIRTTLEYISGSQGYKRACSVLKELNTVSLNIIISWMYVYSRFRYSSMGDLNITVNPNEADQKNIKIADIFDYYFLEHQAKGHLIDINATVVPAYYWLQQLKEETKF